ncbi:SPOSA6832_01044 [Sporobolomyces salmonicolor]|uniref:Nicotinamide-nucleotide adenylyltransferase n=1 Tax=Sporidiobolus salmonicolor TaxID=5005 RepID=A0A0D6EI65_SPOSA|nr:SPOSA6832_01044 [Sporobolomyces salmonicolor]
MEGDYVFPTHRLTSLQGPTTKTPLVLVACGSYSPVTFLHLRLFEMARDDATFNTDFQVVGGYLSPVNDRYAKPGLASACHRVSMCDAAVTDTSEWLMVDPWEARQPDYLPTAQVLDHFDHELNTVRGGADVVVTDPQTGETRIEKKRVRIMLLAGSDLILTMSEPGVWAEKDLHHILGIYGCYIIERAESELDQTIFSSSSVHSRSPLALYRHNIHMVDQLVRNDVSSTKVRMFIRKGMSVKYLIPTVVIRYINRHGLFISFPSIHFARSDIDRPLFRRYRTADRRPGSSASSFSERESLPLDVEEAEREREKERKEDRGCGDQSSSTTPIASASTAPPPPSAQEDVAMTGA